MVDLVPGHTLFDRAGLVMELSELLGTTVDVVAERELKDWVRPQATTEAIAL